MTVLRLNHPAIIRNRNFKEIQSEGSRVSGLCFTFGSSFTRGLFCMRLARSAYRSVLSVSSWLEAAGPMVASMTVLALPPKEFCSRRVSLLSR